MKDTYEIVKQRRGKRVIERKVYIPDEYKVKELRAKINRAINDNEYNAKYLDTIKKEMWGSYEHFAYVRIGAYLFYLSERGVDAFCDCVYKELCPTRTQSVVREYSIRRTYENKMILQKEVYSLSTNGKEDNFNLLLEIRKLPEKKLYERWSRL